MSGPWVYVLNGDSQNPSPFLRCVRLIYLTLVPAFLVVMTILTVLRVRRAAAYAQDKADELEVLTNEP